MNKAESTAEKLGLTKQQIQEFKDAFSLFDQNGDGSISANELGNILKNIGTNSWLHHVTLKGHNPTKQELDDMLAEVDIDKNGTIEFDEFLVLMAQKMRNSVDPDEEIKEAFKVFDKNGDGLGSLYFHLSPTIGYISHSELKQVMKALGENLTDDQVSDMMKQVLL